jgi:orotate phosphoribosyltransferase
MTPADVESIRAALLDMLRAQAVLHGDFTLSSGRRSPYYIDCRRVTLSARGARYVAWSIMHAIHGLPVHAIGGPTISADPIVGACLCTATSWARDDLIGFLVRPKPRIHGTSKWIEGPELRPDMNVVLVDDVATSGESLIRAAEAVMEARCKIFMAIVLLDRLAGAADLLERCDIPLKALATIRDLGLEPEPVPR